MLDSPDLEIPVLDDDHVAALLARTTATSRRARRRRRSSFALAATVVVAAALVLGLVAGEEAPARRFATGTSAWHLVADVTGAFSAQSVTFSGSTLLCPGATTCYAGAEDAGHLVLEVTQDAGAQWAVSSPPGALNLTSLSCVDATTCAALTTTPSGGTFVETTDAGATWSSAAFPATADGIATLSCTSAAECVGVAAAASGISEALVTDDGGASWSSTELPVQASVTEALEVTGLSCHLGGACTLLGSLHTADQWQPFSERSTDGGATWSVGTVPSSFVPGYDFSCVDASRCLAVGDTPSSSPLVLATVDGGARWSEATVPLSSGGFLNWDSCTASACWMSGGAYGHPSSGSHAFLDDSTDLGASWTATSLPSTVDAVGNVACTGGSTCFAVGAESNGTGPSTLVLLTNATGS